MTQVLGQKISDATVNTGSPIKRYRVTESLLKDARKWFKFITKGEDVDFEEQDYVPAERERISTEHPKRTVALETEVVVSAPESSLYATLTKHIESTRAIIEARINSVVSEHNLKDKESRKALGLTPFEKVFKELKHEGVKLLCQDWILDHIANIYCHKSPKSSPESFEEWRKDTKTKLSVILSEVFGHNTSKELKLRLDLAETEAVSVIKYYDSKNLVELNMQKYPCFSEEEILNKLLRDLTGLNTNNEDGLRQIIKGTGMIYDYQAILEAKSIFSITDNESKQIINIAEDLRLVVNEDFTNSEIGTVSGDNMTDQMNTAHKRERDKTRFSIAYDLNKYKNENDIYDTLYPYLYLFSEVQASKFFQRLNCLKSLTCSYAEYNKRCTDQVVDIILNPANELFIDSEENFYRIMGEKMPLRSHFGISFETIREIFNEFAKKWGDE